MADKVRVKRLKDGKVVGKSFRVYKVGNTYYELSPASIIDDKPLTYEVSEDYDRIAQTEHKLRVEKTTIKAYFGAKDQHGRALEVDKDGNPIMTHLSYYEYLLREGYIRKSSAQEIVEGSKGEADARRRVITEELKYLRRYKKMAWEVDKIEALKKERHELQRPRRFHKETKGKKVVSRISYKGRGKGARRVNLYL